MMFTRLFNWLFHASKHKRPIVKDDVLQLPSGARILRLRCSGQFEHAGHYIYDLGAKLLGRTNADGVLLDLSELDYAWGDDLLLTFQIPQHEKIERESCPEAVVTGLSSQPAIETLLVAEAGFDDWRDADFVFTAEQPALDWLSRNAIGKT